MKLFEMLEGVTSVAISGHVRPDGDCVGSCLATYNYIRENYPEIRVDVFLEMVPESFHMLTNIDKVNSTYQTDVVYDMFLSLDCGSVDRLGEAAAIFESAKKTVCRSEERRVGKEC